MSNVKEETIVGLGGLGIFVRSWRPAAKPRAVVAICHGFNAHSGHYFWVANQLVASGFAVYALDLRGRGKSDGERYYVESFADYEDDLHRLIELARTREPNLPMFLLGHSAGGVVACLYALDHRTDLAGLICESFAFQVPAPDFALAVLKGLSHVAPHAHVLKLPHAAFSRDPKHVEMLDADPLIAHEVQPTKTVVADIKAWIDARL